MKQVLLVKMDGIGDYLFFRLFWPQLAELGKKTDTAFDFLCPPYILPLVNKYDRALMRRVFYPCFEKIHTKDRWRSFLPKYKKRCERVQQYQQCQKKYGTACFACRWPGLGS